MADNLFSTQKFALMMAKRKHTKNQVSIDCDNVKRLAIVGGLKGKKIDVQKLDQTLVSQADAMRVICDLLQFETKCDLAKTYQQIVTNI